MELEAGIIGEDGALRPVGGGLAIENNTSVW